MIGDNSRLWHTSFAFHIPMRAACNKREQFIHESNEIIYSSVKSMK